MAITDNRKTVSLTAEDRAAAEELALLLGVSSSELIKEFENLTPEEEAELEALLVQANEVLPSMNATLDRISDRLAETRQTIQEMHEHLARTGERVSRIEQAIDAGGLGHIALAAPAQT